MALRTDRLGGWAALPFFADLPRIQAQLDADPHPILPPEDRVFAALEHCQPADTRVVFLGQDPYHTPGVANGLAFSVVAGQKLPPSLRNIYKELGTEFNATPPDGDLTRWADQGVLLLNDVLTVPEGVARGHRKRIGWEALTVQVLDHLSDRPRAFVLWGNDARAHADRLRACGHHVQESVHPSPLSANRGFFGSRPFSSVNRWLIDQGGAPIDWIKA
jgi:uracil-DNA glycosylase